MHGPHRKSERAKRKSERARRKAEFRVKDTTSAHPLSERNAAAARRSLQHESHFASLAQVPTVQSVRKTSIWCKKAKQPIALRACQADTTLVNKCINVVGGQTPKMHMITFHTEDMRAAAGALRQTFTPYVASFTAWTPQSVRDSGGGHLVRTSSHKLLHNKGLNDIGYGAFKPWILLRELDRVTSGAVVVYRDANVFKYPGYLRSPQQLADVVELALQRAGADVFMPAHVTATGCRGLPLAVHCKTHVVRELGGNLSAVVRDFPLLRANLIAVRNTPRARRLLHEWLDAVQRQDWMAPVPDPGPHDPRFLYHTPEQCLFSILAARGALRGALPPSYPGVAFDLPYCEHLSGCSGLATV